MNEKVSVIIPAYNSEAYLDLCIGSVLKSDYENIEIIVVNDGSTDGTAAVCNRFAHQDSRVKVFHQENGGFCAARNRGLNEATGDYIAFVDSDDAVDSRMISELAGLLSQGAEMAVCSPYYCKRDETEGIDPGGKKIRWLKGHDACLSTVIWGVWVWNKMYRRDIIEKNRIRFDMTCLLSEDQRFNVDYISNITLAACTSQRLYYHIDNEHSCMGQFRYSKIVGPKFKDIPRGWRYTAEHIQDKNGDLYIQCCARSTMFYQTVLRKLKDPDEAYIQEAVSYVKQHRKTLRRYRWGYKFYLSALVLSISYPLWSKIFRRGL